MHLLLLFIVTVISSWAMQTRSAFRKEQEVIRLHFPTGAEIAPPVALTAPDGVFISMILLCSVTYLDRTSWGNINEPGYPTCLRNPLTTLPVTFSSLSASWIGAKALDKLENFK
jgi:hypothetical protein